MKPGDIAVRGVRQSMPSGVVVGRVSGGIGPAELIDLPTLGQGIQATGIIYGPQNPPPPFVQVIADFGLFFIGQPTASQIIFFRKAARAFNLPVSLAGSEFGCDTNPTSTYVLTINKNGSSVGSLSIATDGTVTPTFTTSTTWAIGDTFSITGQVTPDATLTDLWLEFKASFA